MISINGNVHASYMNNYSLYGTTADQTSDKSFGLLLQIWSQGSIINHKESYMPDLITHANFVLSSQEAKYKLNAYQSAWIETIFCLCDQNLYSSASKLIFRTSIAAHRTKAYKKLSEDISSIDISKLPNVILLSLVRNTSSFRQELLCWPDLLNKVEKLLISRDKNASVEILLHGLKDL